MLNALGQRFQGSGLLIKGSLCILLAIYGMVALAPFLTPYGPNEANRKLALLPPTPIYTLDPESGKWRAPYVLGYEKRFLPESLTYIFLPQLDKSYPLQFFVKGKPYKLLGFIPANRHLFGTSSPNGKIHILGTDSYGRDLFSRLLYGGQISLTIGFLALLVSLPMGLLIGGLSGYVGGKLDTLLMRLTEIVMSVPSLFLLISLASILPTSLSSTERFALVTVILALIGWAGLARVIRGMVLAIRQQEFVEAARTLGATHWQLLTRHLLPQTASYVIIAITLGVPGYLLAESGLSFLGLGIQQPDPSWGNLLKEAQEISNLVGRPWMLMPGLLIVLVVWAFNNLGDWLRDVFDPSSVRSV